MAAIGDHRHGDPVAERALELKRVLDMRQWIMVGLQIQDWGIAAGVILGARGAVAGDPLRRQHLGMPASEPAAGIVAGREKGKLQRLQSLGVGQRWIGACLDGLADVTRRIAQVETRAATGAESAARLQRAQAELQDSLATARLLSAAFAEVRATVSRFTGIVPSK